jgi:hypothetical protein
MSDMATIRVRLSALGMRLEAWTPEDLRDVAAQCRHRAARLRRPSGAQPLGAAPREEALRLADEYAAAAALCEQIAARLSSAA